jgi:hypothetical protein
VLLATPRARARLRESLGANDATVEAAADTVRRAQERFAALTLQKRSVHLRATVEAVCERLDGHAVPAIIASMNELVAIQSIATVLANQRDPESTAASREIDLLIAVARRSYGVRGDLEAAQRFREELAGDPAAQISGSGSGNRGASRPVHPARRCRGWDEVSESRIAGKCSAEL